MGLLLKPTGSYRESQGFYRESLGFLWFYGKPQAGHESSQEDYNNTEQRRALARVPLGTSLKTLVAKKTQAPAHLRHHVLNRLVTRGPRLFQE